MKNEIKILLSVIVVLVCSIVVVWFISIDNQINDSGVLVMTVAVAVTAAAIAVAAGAVAVAVAVAAIAAVAGSVAVAAIAAVAGSVAVAALAVAALAAGIIIGVISSNKDNDSFNIKTSICFGIIFLLPFVFIVSLSKYHNQNNLVKDQKIVDILKVVETEGGVKVILPAEYVNENSYLNQTFSIGFGDELQNWKDVAVPHTIGEKKWYEAVSLIEENSSDKLRFFFDHCWVDKDIFVVVK